MTLRLYFWVYIISTNLFSLDFSTIDSYANNQQYDLEFQEINTLSNNTNAEVIWRKARAYFNQAEQQEDLDKKHALFYQSYDFSKEALALDSSLAKANHYYAVLHGQIGLVEGTKQKIINSYDVLKYGQIAIDIDPTYDNTHHLLGRLNFELANLSWFERNFASLIYETPPQGSFEKARDYFQAAIILNANDIRHWLWLGKSYIALDQKKAAAQTLSKAILLTPKDQKDTKNIQEAQQLLNNL